MMSAMMQRAEEPLADALLAGLFEPLKALPHVLAIHTKTDDGTVYVWIVVDDFSRSVREKIYSSEEEIVDHAPKVSFNFHIVTKEIAPTAVPSNAKQVFTTDACLA